ncbi:unnamed protein product [Caenorhabditis angaria]|uniref:Uncharacterized protein n=1 Tax=Caenorhabditis angaria TaxID=860376 RepID=A0A9P1I9H3_9PELO|nr:unnamed protein product [Caenorhabditis angaria]
MKSFLYNTNITQFSLICVGYFTQNRLLNNPTSTAILSYGPCYLFGESTCFNFYSIFLSLTQVVGYSIVSTILFRYLLIRHRSIQNYVVLMISLSYVPAIIQISLVFFARKDFEEVRRLSIISHPFFDFSIYPSITGFPDKSHWTYQTSDALLGFGAYGVPIFSMICCMNILKTIPKNNSMSTKTKQITKTLIHGLICQTVVPMISYIPLFTGYIISQVTGREIIIIEHLLMVAAGFPAIIDPIFSFYFVVPYRNYILTIFKCRPKLTQTSSVVNVSLAARYFTQNRLLNNPTSTAILSYGPCYLFGESTCFNFYSIFLGLTQAVAFLQVSMVFFDDRDFARVRQLSMISHPYFDFSIYQSITGFPSNSAWSYRFAVFLLGFGAYGVPIFSMICCRNILKTIQNNNTMSVKTKQITKTLMHGLICQTVVPMISYIPLYTGYIVSQVTGEELILIGK